MTNFIVNIAKGAEVDIVAAAKTMVTYVDGIFVNDIDPAVANFFTVTIPAEVAALKPYALAAINEVVTDLPTLLTGDVAAFWAALAPALGLTASKALAAGLAVAQTNVLAAVGSVVADAQAALSPTTPSVAS